MSFAVGLARKIYFSNGIYLVSAPSECDHSSEARGHQEPGSAAPALTGGHCWVLGQDVQFVTAASITQHSRHAASSVLTLLHTCTLLFSDLGLVVSRPGPGPKKYRQVEISDY